MTRKYGRRWMADVRSGGKRFRPTFKSEDEANAWEKAAKEAVSMGEPVPDPISFETHKNLSRLGNLFNFVVQTEWQSCRAASGLIQNGKDACSYFGFDRSVSSISMQEIASWKAKLIEKGLSNATINRKLSALSKMLHTAILAGVIDRAPKVKQLPEEKTKFRFLDHDEEEMLLNYFDHVDKDFNDLCILLLDTGARLSEMLNVSFGDFTNNFQQVTFWHTKTNHPRTVPLTRRAKAVLERRFREFPDAPFHNIQQAKFRSAWNKMRSTLAGFANVTPHTLRHTCCTRLVLGGVDIKRVMEWMGHKNISTTMRYMQIRPSALDDVVHVLE